MQCRSRLDCHCSAAQDTLVEKSIMLTTKPRERVCEPSVSSCVLLYW